MWRATLFTARLGHYSAFDSRMQFVVSLVIWRTWIPIFNFICHYLPTSKPLELDSILPRFGKCFSVGKTPPKPFGYASADLCHTSPLLLPLIIPFYVAQIVPLYVVLPQFKNISIISFIFFNIFKFLFFLYRSC